MFGAFSAALRRFSENTVQRFDRIRRASILELFKLIILGTPVDKGHLRNNWRTQAGSPNSSVKDDSDPSGSAAIQEVADNLGPIEGKVFFSNNLPYAERIEYGYSSQAPQGMVRKNVIRWQDIVDAKARTER